MDREYFEGYTGSLIVKKLNNEYKSAQIGEWTRKDFLNYCNAQKKFDSLGRLIEYKEFDLKNDTIVEFDCKYSYKTVKGKSYRVDRMIIFRNNGDTCFFGYRCWRVNVDEFGFYNTSHRHRCGKWKNYNKKGKLIRTRIYRRIK